jgi:Family of unknown function (DUF6011)
MAHRRKRWSGAYIVVWSDNTWEFFRCCRCGNLLNDAASRKRGLGQECAKRAAVDEVWGIQGSRTQEDACVAQVEQG